MLEFPRPLLSTINILIVADDPGESGSQLRSEMKARAVAAIYPLHPHTRSAAHWLLLGEGFDRRVYTPMDFRVVGRVFEQAAGWFLDQLLNDSPDRRATDAGQGGTPRGIPPASLDERIADIECRIIRETLVRCQGHQAEAARQLGLRANTLHYKIKRCGL